MVTQSLCMRKVCQLSIFYAFIGIIFFIHFHFPCCSIIEELKYEIEIQNDPSVMNLHFIRSSVRNFLSEMQLELARNGVNTPHYPHLNIEDSLFIG